MLFLQIIDFLQCFTRATFFYAVWYFCEILRVKSKISLKSECAKKFILFQNHLVLLHLQHPCLGVSLGISIEGCNVPNKPLGIQIDGCKLPFNLCFQW